MDLKRPASVAAAVAAGLAAFYVAAGILVPHAIDAERYRPRIEARLAEATGRKVSLGKLSLTLWRGPAVKAAGIVLGDDAPAKNASELVLTAAEITARAAILPLLRGDVVLRSVSLDGGTLKSRGRVFLDGVRIGCLVRRGSDGSNVFRGRLHGALLVLRSAPRVDVAFDAAVGRDRVILGAIAAKSGEFEMSATGDVNGTVAGGPRASLSGRVRIGRTRAEGTATIDRVLDAPEVVFEITSPFVDFDQMASLAGGAGREAPVASGLGILFAPAIAADPEGGEEVPPAAGSRPEEGPQRFLLRARGRGTLAARGGRFAGLDMKNLFARVTFDGGKVRFEEAAFDLYGGKHTGAFSVDLAAPDAPFLLHSTLDGVDIDRLLTARSPARKNVLHGTASLRLDLAGEAGGDGRSRSLTGGGRLEIHDGKLATIGLLKQVAQLLELAGGRGIGKDDTPFHHLASTLEVRDGRAWTKDLEFRSADLDLDGNGQIGLDGSLHIDAVAAFSRGATADLVRSTPQLKFRVGPSGKLTLPLKIRGNLGAPAVQIDLDRVLQEGVTRSVKGGGAKGVLRRILGKD